MPLVTQKSTINHLFVSQINKSSMGITNTLVKSCALSYNYKKQETPLSYACLSMSKKI